MRPKTTEDVLGLLDGYVISAALGTAMELGLFWLLAERPLSASDVAQALNIPLNRSQRWLRLLCKYDLLVEGAQGYEPSPVARETILEACSQDTWAYMAREDRYKSPAVRDLALNICRPISTWQVQNLTSPDYEERITGDPVEAERFTRALRGS
jgi:hypothetical protein